MKFQEVRVRFAPSPTGGLHLGGVRTALFNYLFARKMNGSFILRVEDTDQNRFVERSEEYVFDCLNWCGIAPDESVHQGGDYGPYRQSERKETYQPYVDQLIKQGHAYYAFDTPEELEMMRQKYKTTDNPNPQYDHQLRGKMRNSLSMSDSDTKQLLAQGVPYVVRIKVPENETVEFTDRIRGPIAHDLNTVDDKVLLKADGMPTYHLASIIDDHLMKISHVFRGEEWLPSAPIHILLWRFLGLEEEMPEYAHLPLILKPDGNGKLSKRDGERLGFPVFALEWTDPEGHTSKGFKEEGFLPEAFLNFLALLGWSPGSEQEIFTLEELCERFSLERVHKGGAKFDYEKAKWFNHQHIQLANEERLAELVLPFFQEAGLEPEKGKLRAVVGMIKERCSLLSDFVAQGSFFFKAPASIDLQAVRNSWSDAKHTFFEKWHARLGTFSSVDAIEESFQAQLQESGMKKKEVMQALRLFVVGGQFGPGIFDIARFLGISELQQRIQFGLQQLKTGA